MDALSLWSVNRCAIRRSRFRIRGFRGTNDRWFLYKTIGERHSNVCLILSITEKADFVLSRLMLTAVGHLFIFELLKFCFDSAFHSLNWVRSWLVYNSLLQVNIKMLHRCDVTMCLWEASNLGPLQSFQIAPYRVRSSNATQLPATESSQ